jgi:cell wall-associated NlpC family hydrolase
MAATLRMLLVGSIATALAAVAATAPAAGSGTPGSTPTEARIAVSVATLWTAPESPRPVDAPAVAAPADPARWLRGLTTAGRRGLNGRVESQALYGQPVQVVEERGAWSRVVLSDQPSPKSPDGYPGWIPTAQLVGPAPSDPSIGAGPTAGSQEAVVTARTLWAHATADLTARAIRLSYGTRLPVVRVEGGVVEVRAPDGDPLWLPADRVTVVAPGAAIRAVTGPAVVSEARRFLGLPYLWGGTSGFGFDCSGLTHTVYAQLGVRIPRDAGPQFAAGQAVGHMRDLRKGDLVFFRNSTGTIHHVGIYAGRGRMIHAPRTGRTVQVTRITTGIWGREFAGGRRYL